MHTTSQISRFHLYVVPWIAIIATLLLAIIFPQESKKYGPWVLLASGIILGMPHGACDLWAIRQATRKTNVRQRLSWFVAAYISIALLMLLLWRVHSGFALLVFLAITVWHFGSGDAWLQGALSEGWLLVSIGRGLIVMAAPLAFQPEATQKILGDFIRLSSSNQDIEYLWKIAPFFLLCGIVLQLFAGFQSTHKQGWRNTNIIHKQIFLWFETLLLLFLFKYTSPLLAIACYFIAVHAWRHILHLELQLSDKILVTRRKSLWLILLFHHRHSLVLTLVTYIGLMPILWQWPHLLNNASQWSVAYLILVSAVTVPHVFLITWLELKGHLRPCHEYSHYECS